MGLKAISKWPWALGLTLVVLAAAITWKVVAGGYSESPVGAVSSSQESETAAAVQLESAFGQLPLHFEAHDGESDEPVEFLARGRGYSLLLKPVETQSTWHRLHRLPPVTSRGLPPQVPYARQFILPP